MIVKNKIYKIQELDKTQMLREFGFFQRTKFQVLNTHNEPVIQNRDLNSPWTTLYICTHK